MASFAAGQRLPAGALNALTSFSVSPGIASVASTGEHVLSPTLVIPAAPIDRIWTATWQSQWRGTTVGDSFDLWIESSDGQGRIRWYVSRTFESATPVHMPAVALPAGESRTVSAKILQQTGTGGITNGADPTSARNSLTVELKAAP